MTKPNHQPRHGDWVTMNESSAIPTATRIQERPDWGAPATLYHLSPPLQGFEYVLVATIGCRDGIYHRGRPKLRIFGCEHNGDINSDIELSAPTAPWRGQRRALARCGYRHIIDSPAS